VYQRESEEESMADAERDEASSEGTRDSGVPSPDGARAIRLPPDDPRAAPELRAAPSTPSSPPGPSAPSSVPPDGRDTSGSEPPPDGREPGRESRRGRFESILPSLIRRGIEKGIEAGLNTLDKSIETGRETTGAVREVINEVKPRAVANAVGRALQEARLPREIAGAVFNQLDETKNDVLRIVAKEVRDFLDATDLAGELKAALTSLSFEVRTEVRFIPNEAGTGVRPEVRARTRIKRGQRDPRRERSRRHARARRGKL
jgi:hypothetical protein